MRLKKRKKRKSKITIIIFIILLGLFITFWVINFFSKNISPILMSYADAETKRLTTLVINKAVTKQLAEDNLSMEDLFEIVTNDQGEIQLINFNSINVTKMLNATTNLIQLNLKSLEEGNVDLLELPDNTYNDNLSNGIKYCSSTLPVKYSGVYFKLIGRIASCAS